MVAEPQRGFDGLLAEVHQRAATADAAAMLDAAVAVSAEHATTADRLLDHFVAHARAAGLSWTDIGTRLGVSKQAARQRFNDRVTPGALPFAAHSGSRLQACLDRAGQHAKADGADEIGTHHLLAGLLAEGVAAAILERVDVTADAIRTASHHLFGKSAGGGATGHAASMSDEAVCALDSAAHHAVASTTGTRTAGTSRVEVGTEHLLAVLALDPGSRARRVLNHLDVDIAAIKRELQCHVTLNPARPARWWKRRPPSQPGCSFCGQPATAAGPLVNGPGVAICVGCVHLATEILDRQPAT